MSAASGPNLSPTSPTSVPAAAPQGKKSSEFTDSDALPHVQPPFVPTVHSMPSIDISDEVGKVLAEFEITSITDETEKLVYASLLLRIKHPATEPKEIKGQQIIDALQVELEKQNLEPIPFLNIDIDLLSSFSTITPVIKCRVI